MHRRSRSGSAARVALAVVGAAVTVVFGYFAVRGVRFHEVWDALRASNYWWLFPAFATLVLAFWIRALRWRFLFSPPTRPPLRAAFDSLLVCFFFNSVMPARAGDAIRVVALHQRAGTSRAETAGTVVIERAYDVMTVLVLLFVATPWLPQVSWLRAAAFLAIGVGVGLAATAFALARWGDRPFLRAVRVLGRVPFVPVDQLEAVIANLVVGLDGLRRTRLALIALSLSMLAWLVGGLSAWFVMLEFDLGLSPMAGILVQVAIGLAVILPSAPAAVGVFEAAAVVSLGAYGISGSQALSYALILHVLNLIPFLVVGPLVLRARRPGKAKAPSPQPASQGF